MSRRSALASAGRRSRCLPGARKCPHRSAPAPEAPVPRPSASDARRSEAIAQSPQARGKREEGGRPRDRRRAVADPHAARAGQRYLPARMDGHPRGDRGPGQGPVAGRIGGDGRGRSRPREPGDAARARPRSESARCRGRAARNRSAALHAHPGRSRGEGPDRGQGRDRRRRARAGGCQQRRRRIRSRAGAPDASRRRHDRRHPRSEDVRRCQPGQSRCAPADRRRGRRTRARARGPGLARAGAPTVRASHGSARRAALRRGRRACRRYAARCRRIISTRARACIAPISRRRSHFSRRACATTRTNVAGGAEAQGRATRAREAGQDRAARRRMARAASERGDACFSTWRRISRSSSCANPARARVPASPSGCWARAPVRDPTC